MSPKAKKILFISLGVIAVAAAAYFFYSQSSSAAVGNSQPPSLVVTGWDTSGAVPIASFTFGGATGSTLTNSTLTNGTWALSNIGNALTITNNGAIYKTVAITGTGTII